MEFTKLVATKANTASQHWDVAAMCKPSVRAFCSRSQGVPHAPSGSETLNPIILNPHLPRIKPSPESPSSWGARVLPPTPTSTPPPPPLPSQKSFCTWKRPIPSVRSRGVRLPGLQQLRGSLRVPVQSTEIAPHPRNLIKKDSGTDLNSRELPI